MLGSVSLRTALFEGTCARRKRRVDAGTGWDLNPRRHEFPNSGLRRSLCSLCVERTHICEWFPASARKVWEGLEVTAGYRVGWGAKSEDMSLVTNREEWCMIPTHLPEVAGWSGENMFEEKCADGMMACSGMDYTFVESTVVDMVKSWASCDSVSCVEKNFDLFFN